MKLRLRPHLRARFFHGLADPSRLVLLDTLGAGERTARDAAVAVGLFASNASRHLACLGECGLVEARQEWRHVYYQLADGIAQLLAAYVTFESASTLLAREAPDVTPVGPALVIVSLIVMPVLAWGKWQVARRINSAALKTDSQEAMLCVYLSAIFLVGFAANALFGWWRAEPVAGLGVAALAVKEGWEAVANQDLCCDEQPIRSTLPVAASHGTDSAVAPAPG